VNTGQVEVGRQRHYEALELFRAQGSTEGMAATHDLLALSYGMTGNISASEEHVGQAIALFREAGDKRGLISSLMAYCALAHMSDILPWIAQPLPGIYRQATEAVDLAQQIGWLAGQAEVGWMFGLTLAIHGELGKALGLADEALRTASEIGHRQWVTAALFAIGYIQLLLLEPETAADHLSQARSMAYELGSAWWIGYSSAFLALAQLRLGHIAEARRELESAAAGLGLQAGWPTQAPRTTVERYLCLAWCEAALAEGQPAEALAVAKQLIESAVNPNHQPIPNLLRLKAQALLALGQLAEAEAALGLAQKTAREQDTPPILWQIHQDRARLAQQLGHAQDAARERQAASAIIDQLAKALSEPEREAFRQRASR